MQSWITGETKPRIFTLYSDEGVVQNLTGCTVALLLTAADGTEIDTTGWTAIEGTPSNGQVKVTPAPNQLLDSRSPIAALFQVTDGTGAVAYYPGEGADTWFVYPARTAFPRLTFRDLRIATHRWLDVNEDLDQGTNMDLLIKQVLNDAALARATEYPWPFMKATYRLAVTTDVRRYTLPGNLARLSFVWSPYGHRYATRVPTRMLDQTGIHPDVDATERSGVFMPFELQGPVLVFFEDPPANETLTLGYVRTPSKLLHDTDLPDLPYPHGRLLVWDALLDLKAYAEETQNAALWADKQKRAETALYQAFVEGQTLGAMPLAIKTGYELR